ncbi:MAG: ATP-binding protein [Muribaculaceae bacterium]|nr:ATP-binding protein [Muribaculaceae bacterium]
MEFLDRKEETAELKRVLDPKRNSSFVVVFGRRRLGKSTLIRRVLEKTDIYYVGGDIIDPIQREMFKSQVKEVYPEFGLAQYSGWEEMLKMLNKLADRRFTLCLDEFPYIVKHAHELPSILQRLIDAGELKFNIIICGSSQRMMQNMILSKAEPLYGRAQAILDIRPIPIAYLQEALSLSAIQTIEEYSVWGGVPRYWELREDYEGLEEAMRGMLLSTTGVLYDEPKKLFLDDMMSVVQSESLMAVIAGGANRISEIAARMNRDASALSGPIERLISMNYIRREIPFGESPKKSKKGVYRINDPMMDFYYTFIMPNLSSIGRGRRTYVTELIKQNFNEYVARHWEHLCRECVSGNKLFDYMWKDAARWWGSVKIDNTIYPMEFDVMAESLDGSALLVGECKWTNPEIAGELHKKLLEKAGRLSFAQNKEIIPVLFLKYPPKDADIVSSLNILYPEDVVRLAYGEE